MKKMKFIINNRIFKKLQKKTSNLIIVYSDIFHIFEFINDDKEKSKSLCKHALATSTSLNVSYSHGGEINNIDDIMRLKKNIKICVICEKSFISKLKKVMINE